MSVDTWLGDLEVVPGDVLGGGHWLGEGQGGHGALGDPRSCHSCSYLHLRGQGSCSCYLVTKVKVLGMGNLLLVNLGSHHQSSL